MVKASVAYLLLPSVYHLGLVCHDRLIFPDRVNSRVYKLHIRM